MSVSGPLPLCSFPSQIRGIISQNHIDLSLGVFAVDGRQTGGTPGESRQGCREAELRPGELRQARDEAVARGPDWCNRIEASLDRLPAARKRLLQAADA